MTMKLYRHALQVFTLMVIATSSFASAQDQTSSADDRSLLNSDGSQFVPQACFPKFSWDKVPTYSMFGNENKLLKPDQVKSIANRTDFMCIEKSHGKKVLGAAELGAKHEAAALKKVNPDAKVLFYFNAAYAWPFTSYNKSFTKGSIDKEPKLKSFLITNKKSGKLAERYGAFLFRCLKFRVSRLVGGNRSQRC